ncbi:MAG: hypothetical protein Ct9H300mP8_12570 [Gammaproteobacteria bacterium]|nr:MAG: hypothetical protein Ct9H300mP8_12570 [Gammaproteobacteria bacterium]
MRNDFTPNRKLLRPHRIGTEWGGCFRPGDEACVFGNPRLASTPSKIAPLERQALQLLIDEPLKLGAIGTAILDIYYGSLAGHLALPSFYERVEDKTRRIASHWAKRIVTAIGTTATEAANNPIAFCQVRKHDPT